MNPLEMAHTTQMSFTHSVVQATNAETWFFCLWNGDKWIDPKSHVFIQQIQSSQGMLGTVLGARDSTGHIAKFLPSLNLHFIGGDKYLKINTPMSYNVR